MRKVFITLVVSVTMAGLFSCGYKNEAKRAVSDLFSSVKSGNEDAMKQLYPEIENLTNYRKSDSIIIRDISEADSNKYNIILTNIYTNGFGKKSEMDITIYTKPKNIENPKEGYIIYDSKGLCDLSDEDAYKFAKRNGYIKSDSLTDQQVYAKIKEASKEMIDLSIKFYGYLMTNVKVHDWSWESSNYSSSAHGSGVVSNNSPFPVRKVKYKVSYLRNGTCVAQDDGWVSYDEIAPYSMKSFSFFTSHAGNASRARITLDFDIEYMTEMVASGQFTEADWKIYEAKMKELNK